MFFFFVVHEIALNIHERNIRAMFVKFRGCFFVVREKTLNIHERNIRAMFVKFRGCFFVVHEIALNIHERNIRARFVKFRGCFFCCPRNSTKHSRKKYSYKVCEVSWMFFFVVHEKTLNVHERNIRARFVKFRGCFFVY